MTSTMAIIEAISTVRLRKVMDELQIQDAIEQSLKDSQLSYEREVKIAPRCRLDFFVEGGIAVEVKKRRPERAKLIAQLGRYAEQEYVRSIIVVLEKSIQLPERILGKPVTVLSLNSLWGVAL